MVPTVTPNATVARAPDGEPVLEQVWGNEPTKALRRLEAEIAARMPGRDLVDVLYAVERHTG